MTGQTPERGTVLAVDENSTELGLLLGYLQRQGLGVLVARNGEGALEQARCALPDLILLTVPTPGVDGYETARRLKADPATAGIPIVIVAARADPGATMRGFAAGAADCIAKPFRQEEVLARVSVHLRLHRRQCELEHANADLQQRVAERSAELERALAEVARLTERLHADHRYREEEIRLECSHGQIVGESQALARVLHLVRQVAGTEANVLILGETGTGKELIAHAVHETSSRQSRPLVKVNCAALPANLIENELFGHEKGAFTGALARRIGRFELADGGTILLDEIGELPLELQAKLLRVLQEGELERLGSPRSLKVDVRVLAAANRNLKESVAQGGFREDLYYRLNVFPIELPPLRKRPEDIPALVRHFIGKHAKRLGRTGGAVSPQDMERLMAYPWPGNVRELENLIERALILATGPALPIDGLVDSHPATRPAPPPGRTLEDAQRRHVYAVLEETAWQIQGPGGAAERLAINPSTLRSRMRKLGIERPRPGGRAAVGGTAA